jgi:hypothetical protein
MIRLFVKTMPARIKDYVRENWGAPFVLGFMLFLSAAAVLLSIGLDDVANGLAISGYYALVFGVVLQLVSFLKHRKKDGQLD